jgi:hypothetical protein
MNDRVFILHILTVLNRESRYDGERILQESTNYFSFFQLGFDITDYNWLQHCRTQKAKTEKTFSTSIFAFNKFFSNIVYSKKDFHIFSP